MKLKTLNINNIASIEDALIDFSSQMLADAGMFLICGPTGSGKSTILDAICLALFNTTPRIENSTSDMIDLLSDDGSKEKVKDVLHLVRKNAVNASVTLVFEGIDGEDYTASWRVYRTGQYRGGKEVSKFKNETLEDKLKRSFIKEWTLTDATGNVYQRDREVASKIVEVIGMDFNQFCKTTMLAQGDFTKFLSCKSDEKASILEKLVGVTKYSEVGAAINQLTLKKKSEIDALSQQLASETFLTDDERQQIARNIALLNDEIRALKELKSTIDTKIKWINDYDKAVAAVKIAENTLKIATSILESDEVKQDQNTINLWDITSDIRQALLTQRKCKAECEAQNNRIENLHTRYNDLLDGTLALTEEKKDLVDKNKAMALHLEANSKYEPMYEEANTIIDINDSIIKQKKVIDTNETKISEYNDRLSKLKEDQTKLNEQKASIEAEIEKKRDEAEIIKNKRAEYHPETIDEETQAIHNHKNLVAQVEYASRNVAYTQGDCDTKLKALENAKVDTAKLEKEVEESKTRLEAAKQNLAESKNLYERTLASVSDHAKALRSQLVVGGACPVCGSRIEEIINEQSFVEALRPLEEKYRADEDKHNTLTKSNADILGEYKAASTNLKRITKEYDGAKSSLIKFTEDLKAKCDILKVDIDDLDSSLQCLKTKDTAAEEALSIRKERIKSLDKEYDAINQHVNKVLVKKSNDIDKELNRLLKAIGDLEKDLSRAEGEIKNAQTNINAFQQRLSELIDPTWTPKVKDDYYSELRAAASMYFETKNNHAENERKIQTIDQNLDLISASREDIESRFVEWESDIPTEPRHVNDIVKEWAKLRSDCLALYSAIKATNDTMAEVEKVISDFTKANSGIAMNDVINILDVSDMQIVSLRDKLAQLKDNKSRAESLLSAARDNLEELENKSPLAEGDTLEALNEQASTTENTQKEKDQAIGALQNGLANDDKLKEKCGQLQSRLEKLREEYGEWKILDNYLGSTDGKRFRNVAQSFILIELLQKANSYLENITGRYELFCNPGTLTIMMRDKFQGGVVRPTNTLSGGESFIISLALALGLSSMQSSGFEVDTLFIDEGFGTLSPELLDPVITTLKRLNEKYQRRVGIISHVEALKTRIPVTIEVIRQGKSRSKIDVIANNV